jgi:putative hydrolase of the HAD superfamily
MTSNTARPWPKAILFDLDDTLWPIAPVIARAEDSLYAWLQQHAPGVTARHTVDTLRQARLALLKEQPVLGVDLAILRRHGLLAAFREAGEDEARVDEAIRHFQERRNQVAFFDDVPDGLRELAQLVTLGSISNGNANLEAIGLSHHFKVSVAAHQLGKLKPDAAVFLEACRRLGIDPGDAVYVGDDILLDVQGAQRAGMRAVWMNRTGSQAHLEHGVVPDAICSDFRALLDWLRREHA